MGPTGMYFVMSKRSMPHVPATGQPAVRFSCIAVAICCGASQSVLIDLICTC